MRRKQWRGVYREYRKILPKIKSGNIITLGEGNTPLIRADRLAWEIEFRGSLYLKFEGANPTGSFKDRGMTVAVSKAKEDGAKMLICASTGNTAASSAAYGAEAEIPVAVLVPFNGIAEGKLRQMAAYGARIVQIDGSFDDCQKIMREVVAQHKGVVPINSINFNRLQGQKTASFEIVEALGRPPDYHFIPVGNGGNITAYWMGYREAVGAPVISPSLRFFIPVVVGVQAEGAAPLVRGRIIEKPRTIASAIRVGNPARWHEALSAACVSGGWISAVSDEEIMAMHALVPRLCPNAACEPASAASVAGLLKAIRTKRVRNKKEAVAVCVLTGNIMKDLGAVSGMPDMSRPDSDATLEGVERSLDLG